MGFLYAMYGPSMMNNCTKDDEDDEDYWDEDVKEVNSNEDKIELKLDTSTSRIIKYEGTAEKFISDIKLINPSLQLDDNYDYVRVIDDITHKAFYVRPGGGIKFDKGCIVSYKVEE